MRRCALTLLLGLAACSEAHSTDDAAVDSGPDAGTGTGVDAGDDAGPDLGPMRAFFDAYVTAACDGMAARCTMADLLPDWDIAWALRPASCRAEAHVLGEGAYLDDAASGRRVFDASAAATCIAEVRAGGCAPPDRLVTAGACGRVFSWAPTFSLGLAGDECWDTPCVPGLVCPSSSGACVARHCADPVRVGQPCTDVTQCEESTTAWSVCDGTCHLMPVATPGLGDACGLYAWCSAGLYCIGGTCRPRIEVGETCPTTAASVFCAIGSRCGAGAGATCQPFAVSGEGQPCDELAASPFDSWTTVCDQPRALECLGGLCTRRSARPIGALCADAPMGCEAGLQCVDGQCLHGQPGGTRCSTPDECLSASCGADGRCAACP